MVKEPEVLDSTLKTLLDRMVAAKQLSSTDAAALSRQSRPGRSRRSESEEDVLRWLAEEYGLAFTTLDDVEPDRQLLSLFPARILLKEELLPLASASTARWKWPPAASLPRRDWTRSRP